MAWQMLWPEFVKKRLCRYLLQHYLGHFFKEKISLEQLSIDIYNGTGCVKNLHLDCDALNEQLNSNNNNNGSSSSSSSTMPIEIVSGFVGYISIYIPWHDLFNDYCKLTIKNVQITVRVKQTAAASRPSTCPAGEPTGVANDADDDDDDIDHHHQQHQQQQQQQYHTAANSMFSSVLIDSLMNTSMSIAQECLLSEERAAADEAECSSSDLMFESMENSQHSTASASSSFYSTKRKHSDTSISGTGGGGAASASLLGLEAFASTIDSILSRIKINLEHVQIRLESVDTTTTTATRDRAAASGTALELRIKSIKYFDLDSTSQSAATSASDTAAAAGAKAAAAAAAATSGGVLRNTTKTLNVEGLTIYFDEFILRDEQDDDDEAEEEDESDDDENEKAEAAAADDEVEQQGGEASNETSTSQQQQQHQPPPPPPQDEAAPFNYELPASEYLFTKPVICVTFSGVQSLKLTINNMRPTDLIIEAAHAHQHQQPTAAAAAAAANTLGQSKQLNNQQRPMLELSAQLGSVKCLLCPRQIHLLGAMCAKIQRYVDEAEAARLALKRIHYKHQQLRRRMRAAAAAAAAAASSTTSNATAGGNKLIRGFDKRKPLSPLPSASSMMESSSMFYSMVSESSHFPEVPLGGGGTYHHQHRARVDTENSSESSEANDEENDDDDDDDEVAKHAAFSKEMSAVIEQLQSDVIAHGHKSRSSNSNSTSNNNHLFFQTFKVSVRMISLTVLHTDPAVVVVVAASPTASASSFAAAATSSNCSSIVKRLIVSRMKPVADVYFDWASSIDMMSQQQQQQQNTASSSSSTCCIEKSTVARYHEACALNDHFLLLVKPLTLHLVQKINQYSFNDVALTLGYMQLDEYLASSATTSPHQQQQQANSHSHTVTPNKQRRVKSSTLAQASRSACITEIVRFVEPAASSHASSTSSAPGGDHPGSMEHHQQQQPCVKLQVAVYEPGSHVDSPVVVVVPKTRAVYGGARLLARRFCNVSATFGQAIVAEMDISLVDRLYFLLNGGDEDESDASEQTNAKASSSKTKTSSSSSAHHHHHSATRKSNLRSANAPPPPPPPPPPAAGGAPPSASMASTAAKTDMLVNISVWCSQVVKLTMRFPVADLTRASPPAKSTTLPVPATSMIGVRHLREQLLTFHIFELRFRTLLNHHHQHQQQHQQQQQIDSAAATAFIITATQLNAYYQYTRADRPIHFALIQQQANTSSSLILCSIKVPFASHPQPQPQPQQPPQPNHQSKQSAATSDEMDSLRHVYHINVTRPNKFESSGRRDAMAEDASFGHPSANHNDSGGNEENNGDDDDDDDDGNYGPFSRIHSLISSEKNRRIVNAGNKAEMAQFERDSTQHAAVRVRLRLPALKCLIADQRFLNDIYNCVLNDLLMWQPCVAPPIQSPSTSSSMVGQSHLSAAAAAAGAAVVVNCWPLQQQQQHQQRDDSDVLMPSSGSAESVAGSTDEKMFHMCRSSTAAAPPPLHSATVREEDEKSDNDDKHSSSSDDNDDDDDDDDNEGSESEEATRFRLRSARHKQPKKKKTLSLKMCLAIHIDTAHLKAFVLNEPPAAAAAAAENALLKYGEFDIKTSNFQICVATNDTPLAAAADVKANAATNKMRFGGKTRRGGSKQPQQQQANTQCRIEKQYVSLLTDQISIAHATKTCPPGHTQLKYPTNYTSFESLFGMSKTRTLIRSTDASVFKSLFNNDDHHSTAAAAQDAAAAAAAALLLQVPMVSIAIKAKFDTRSNTKQVLVALNFNGLTLHHLFCQQSDHWIFQLIALLDLIDIDIVGYEVPIVFTELHLNVANSCVVYNPLYLSSSAVVAFKSLHWSSNVTAESTLTLLVFNIEDIYLFLSKSSRAAASSSPASASSASASTTGDNVSTATTITAMSTNSSENGNGNGSNLGEYVEIDLKRDYVCLANSYLFELRLLISDEDKVSPAVAAKRAAAAAASGEKKVKTPLLDIKLRSNHIQVRTCVDSAFALIELINYIVSDGDLHQINPIMSEFMANTPTAAAAANIAATTPTNLASFGSLPPIAEPYSTSQQYGEQYASSSSGSSSSLHHHFQLHAPSSNVADELSQAIGSERTHLQHHNHNHNHNQNHHHYHPHLASHYHHPNLGNLTRNTSASSLRAGASSSTLAATGPATASSSIPIVMTCSTASTTSTFTVGTPPSTIATFIGQSHQQQQQQQQAYYSSSYSPMKTPSSSSTSYQDAASSFSSTSRCGLSMQAAASSSSSSATKTLPISMPLPTPLLNYNTRLAGHYAGGGGGTSHLSSSSNDSLITDMVKEAMHTNPMTQSIYGSLDANSSNSFMPPPQRNAAISKQRSNTTTQYQHQQQQQQHSATRKRYTSLSAIVSSPPTTTNTSGDDDDVEDQVEKAAQLASEMHSSSIENMMMLKSDDDDDDDESELKSNKPEKGDDDEEEDEEEEEEEESDEDDILIRSIDRNNFNRMGGGDAKSAATTSVNKHSTTTAAAVKKGQEDDDEFHFDLPFSNLSPMSPLTTSSLAAAATATTTTTNTTTSTTTGKTVRHQTSIMSDSTAKSNNTSLSATHRQLRFDEGKDASSSSASSASATASKTATTTATTTTTTHRRPLYFQSTEDVEQENLDASLRRRRRSQQSNHNDDENDCTNDSNDDHDHDDDDIIDEDILKDFDIIEVIPGLGEPPRNNQDYEVKVLKASAKRSTFHQRAPSPGAAHIRIKDEHFKKPLSKIDELKAPDTYPVPLNVFCVQEISLNWCLYGGSDFAAPASHPPPPPASANDQTMHAEAATSGESSAASTTSTSASKMNRTVSSPIIVASSSKPQHLASMPSPTFAASSSSGGGGVIMRSRHNSTASSSVNSLSISPNNNNNTSYSYSHFQSPPRHHATTTTTGTTPTTSPLASTGGVRFSARTSSINFSSSSGASATSASSGNTTTSKEKCLPRVAGGRILTKYDTHGLNWLARGGRARNLDVCMEIALHKVKTKVDVYADLNAEPATLIGDEARKQEQEETSSEAPPPYLYRVALAIGDIEIRDKLASSAFNMFLFRYESEHCPKHTNSSMLFLKFLCSRSMDAQRLIECDIKLSIQPLRFNIDQDALVFLVEFFQKLAERDLNEFSKTLVPPPPTPPPPPQTPSSPLLAPQFAEEHLQQQQQQQQLPPQQVFIRNFIFSPDLSVKFDFSGKYDRRPANKMDTMTKLLMVAIQLSNTEIKLKRVYYRRGFLGAEKLMQALLREWLADIQRHQMKNLIKGWALFNSLIQFVEGFTYLVWYPIEQYRKDGRVLCGLQRGSAAFSTCTVLATIELTNRMFQVTKNIAEFFYDLVTPHRANAFHQHHYLHHHHHQQQQQQQLRRASSSSTVLSLSPSSSSASAGQSVALVDTLLSGVVNNRNIRMRRQPNDIREGLTNAYYVLYEGFNDTAANLINEISHGAEYKGLPGAIGGALRQLPSTALAPILHTTEATCNILSGIRNQLKPDEKRDDDQKWKTIAFNT